MSLLGFLRRISRPIDIRREAYMDGLLYFLLRDLFHLDKRLTSQVCQGFRVEASLAPLAIEVSADKCSMRWVKRARNEGA